MGAPGKDIVVVRFDIGENCTVESGCGGYCETAVRVKQRNPRPGFVIELTSPPNLETHKRPPAIVNDASLYPGKVFPTLRRCAEGGAMHVHRGEEKFPELERF